MWKEIQHYAWGVEIYPLFWSYAGSRYGSKDLNTCLKTFEYILSQIRQHDDIFWIQYSCRINVHINIYYLAKNKVNSKHGITK